METELATVIPLNQRRSTTSTTVWTTLAEADTHHGEELDALRWALLETWAELHWLKCGCSLDARHCRRPMPGVLEQWLASRVAWSSRR